MVGNELENIELTASFLEMAEVCNSQHISTCDCKNKEITELYEQFLADDKAVIEKYEAEGERLIAAARRESCKRAAIESVAQSCVSKSERCIKEIADISLVIKMFSKKYDLDDVRVFMIVKSVIAHKLSATRMQRYSSVKGILQEYWDRQGNQCFAVNPVEKAKMDFDDSIIKAIQILDKIIEGDKSSVEHRGKIDLATVFQSIEDIAR